MIFAIFQVKQHWAGHFYKNEGVAGNDIQKTNLPDIRVAYRHETLLDELHFVSLYFHSLNRLDSGSNSKA